MAKTSTSVASVQIDVTPLRKLAGDLRKVSPASATALRVAMRSVGQIVADEAKSNAGFSKKIPGSIAVRTSGLSLKVTAGGAAAPNAPPLENNGQTGSFRHPVFGNTKVWVNQAAHPFLAPAMDDKAPEVEAAITDAIGDAMRDAGFDLEG